MGLTQTAAFQPVTFPWIIFEFSVLYGNLRRTA
jgi:hypothetical protein